MRGAPALGAVAMLLAAAAAAASVLHVSRTRIDFGAHAYIARPQTFVLTNVGDAPWRVADVVVDGPDAALFSIASAQCPAGSRIPPGGRCTFEVNFVPSGTGSKRARVHIVGAGLRVELRATAVERRKDALGPIALIFARGIDLAFPLSETIEVSNAGDAPLTLVGVQIESSAPGAFEIASACALPAVLEMGEHCWITVSMTGAGASPWSAELVVDTAELGSYRVGVTGYQPPIPDALPP